MRNKSWDLGDVQKLVDEIQNKFFKPSIEIIEPIEKGHKVKLTFNFKSDTPKAPNNEQLWVDILLVQDNKFLGQLEDNPKYIQELKCGEIIEFEARNIIDTD